MQKYSMTPALPGIAPQQWPASPSLKMIEGKPALVMFAHPKCPCTRASLSELSRIVSNRQDRVMAIVVFMNYATEQNSWDHTNLWDQAVSIPGVQVVRDEQGELSHRFGAVCSGETYFYDSKRNLAFHGGITSSRGHEGDNSGHDAIVSLIQGYATETPTHPVFGCSLKCSHSHQEETL